MYQSMYILYVSECCLSCICDAPLGHVAVPKYRRIDDSGLLPIDWATYYVRACLSLCASVQHIGYNFSKTGEETCSFFVYMLE